MDFSGLPSIFLKKGVHEALRLASLSLILKEVPVGAVVMDSLTGTILGRGWNLKETFYNPTAHAEILAIQEACRSVKNWRLVSGLLITTLEPCVMCLAVAQQSRLKAIYYMAEDTKGGALSLGYHVHQDPKLNHQLEAYYVPESKSQELLKNFFKEKRAQKRLEKAKAVKIKNILT